jgi:hypothetical protein
MKWIETFGEALSRAGRRSIHLGSVRVSEHFLSKSLSPLLCHDVFLRKDKG